MKKLIGKLAISFALVSAFSAHAASELKLGNLGQWKMIQMDPNTKFLPEVEAKLVLPMGADEYSPSIYVEKLPVVAVPESVEEWNHLIFLKRKPRPVLSRPEVLHKTGEQYRYVVEFQTPQKSQTPMNTVVMAVSLNGEVYVFSFSNHRLTYQDNVPAIRELFRTMEIGLIQSTRP